MLIKRIVRYLQGKPQVAIHYGFQDPGQDVIVLTHSDWAGCVETRRSTSGWGSQAWMAHYNLVVQVAESSGSVIVRGRVELYAQRSNRGTDCPKAGQCVQRLAEP